MLSETVLQHIWFHTRVTYVPHKVQALNIEQRPGSDFHHVTAPYNLSYYKIITTSEAVILVMSVGLSVRNMIPSKSLDV